MVQFLKNNWFKIFLIAILLIGTSGIFYWYGWRPSKIKHDCSWTEKHKDAIPAQSAISGPSEKEMKAAQEDFDNCEKVDHSTFACLNSRIHLDNLKKQDQPAKPAQPAKDWWEKATKEEYNFCLHDKGL